MNHPSRAPAPRSQTHTHRRGVPIPPPRERGHKRRSEGGGEPGSKRAVISHRAFHSDAVFFAPHRVHDFSQKDARPAAKKLFGNQDIRTLLTRLMGNACRGVRMGRHAITLVGPRGVGKRSIVLEAARENGVAVFEVNRCNRNPEDLLTALEDASNLDRAVVYFDQCDRIWNTSRGTAMSDAVEYFRRNWMQSEECDILLVFAFESPPVLRAVDGETMSVSAEFDPIAHGMLLSNLYYVTPPEGIQDAMGRVRVYPRREIIQEAARKAGFTSAFSDNDMRQLLVASAHCTPREIHDFFSRVQMRSCLRQSPASHTFADGDDGQAVHRPHLCATIQPTMGDVRACMEHLAVQGRGNVPSLTWYSAYDMNIRPYLDFGKNYPHAPYLYRGDRNTLTEWPAGDAAASNGIVTGGSMVDAMNGVLM